ncbi:MAG: FUSC family protein [Motilibacteraceae bacterium]
MRAARRAPASVRPHPRRMGRRVGRLLSRVEPGPALRVVKTALAGALGWFVATRVLGTPSPWFATIAAVVTVQTTVRRTVVNGARKVVATLLGVLLAYISVRMLGIASWSIGLVLLVAVALGRWRRLGDAGTDVPVVAVFAMTVAGASQQTALAERVLETGLGALIGAAVTLLVVPPLRVGEAERDLHRTATRTCALLHDVADGLAGDWDAKQAGEWLRRAEQVRRLAAQTRDTVRGAQESLRLNPRTRLHAVDPDGYVAAATTLGRVADQLYAVIRTLADAADDSSRIPRPGGEFLTAYADLLRRTGTVVSSFGHRTAEGDGPAPVQEAVDRATVRLDDVVEQVREQGLADLEAWPAYGALLTDVERIVLELGHRGEEALVPETPPARSRLV